MCRICYSNNTESPLISPCNCTGSLKYIHLKCLQSWLKTKVKIDINKKNSVIQYILNPIQCEVCKEYLPDFYKKENKLYEICEFKCDFNSYITFETLISERHHYKIIYIVKLDNNNSSFIIGRDPNCDISVKDISLSRNNSLIFNRNNDIYIKDLGSRFGTNILLQNEITLIDNNPIAIRINNIVIYYIQKLSIIGSICCCSGQRANEYEAQNKEGINFEKDYIVKEDKSNDKLDNTNKNEIAAKGLNGFIELQGSHPISEINKELE